MLKPESSIKQLTNVQKNNIKLTEDMPEASSVTQLGCVGASLTDSTDRNSSTFNSKSLLMS